MFEMFFRSCNCCRRIKTRKSCKWYSNPWGSQERRHGFCLVFEEKGTPPSTHKKVGHGFCLAPAVCLLSITWARCQEGRGAVLGRSWTLQEMPVLRTKAFLSAELPLQWSWMWSLGLWKLMVKCPWTLVWSKFHPLGLTAVQLLPKPEPGLLPYAEFPSAAMECGLGCISPIKQTELYDARVFESWFSSAFPFHWAQSLAWMQPTISVHKKRLHRK